MEESKSGDSGNVYLELGTIKVSTKNSSKKVQTESIASLAMGASICHENKESCLDFDEDERTPLIKVD